MKKRMLSLLCVLALCLGLLPVTALAAAPIGQVLYVGGVQISSTGYWTTDSDGNVTASTAGETPTDNYIHYDAENNVLTLHNATIKKGLEFNESIEGGTFISGSAIGVFNKSGNAELTISLVGTNTIANVGKGIFVLASSASTGSSNLTIQGDGSLNASASQTGIWVQSNSNNAALCVENAEVTASVDGVFKNGVLVQAEDGSDVSLTVNGGSLTASVNANIWFQFGSGVSGSGTPTVTVSNNAIVRANGGIANTSSTSIQYGTGNGENGGIVFDGSAGTVYGSVTLQDDLEIKSGETLTVPDGSSLNCNGNLTNNGTILASGGTVTGSLSGGTAVTTPSITAQPTGNTVTEGSAAEFSITATAGSENPTYQWQQSTDNGSNWTNIESATSASYTTETTNTSMSGFQYRCVVTSASGVSVISSAAILTVQTKPATVPVTGVTLNKNTLELYTGKSETLIATVQPDNATNKAVTWSSDNAEVATVEGGTVTAVGAGETTITVTTDDGSKQATCKVKVTDPVYNMTTDTANLDFGKVYTGYDRPTAKTVTITNTGNQQVTVTLPTAKDFVIMAGDGFANGIATIEPGKTATFTVQPKADLAVGSHEESINISGSNGNNKVSTSVDATFAVVDINDTSVDNKLTITSGISDGISGTAFTTPEAVKAELTRVLVQDTAYTAGNTAFYDVKLQYSLDGGATWIEATEATFPTEGITVTLPYPSGTDKNNYDYRVVHMFTVTSTRLGTTAGNTEAPAVTKTDSGLQVTLRGLSPVVIGWDKIETPSSGGSTTPAATATPAPSDNITYYTCPSCGYHNWTATDAGYRCDNCGYLESTRQLSGYGNVKGTYTPGSGATSTAASAVPQTGDESNPVLWTVLLLVSGLALGGLAIAKRKKQQ